MQSAVFGNYNLRHATYNHYRMWIGYEKYTIPGSFRFVQQTENIMVQFFGGFESKELNRFAVA